MVVVPFEDLMSVMELQQKNGHVVKLQYFVYLFFWQTPLVISILKQNVAFFGCIMFQYVQRQ